MNAVSADPLADAETVCPVTGLPVRSWPQWTDHRFGGDYRLTTRVVGDHILLDLPAGHAKLDDIIASLQMTDDVVSSHIDVSAGYVQVFDYSGLQGITRGALWYHNRHLATRENLRGLIYFGVNPLLRLMIKMAKRVSRLKLNLRIVKDYQAAMSAAIGLMGIDPVPPPSSILSPGLREAGISEHHEKGHQILRCEGWRLEIDDYRLNVEVIDGHIYHALSSGTLREQHVVPVARLRERVRRMIGREQGFRALITGTADAHASDHTARKHYMASLRRWHHHYPMQIYIFYNANRLIRSAAMLAIPFMPFKVKVTQNLDAALEMTGRFARVPAPVGAIRRRAEPSVAEDPVHVVHQLLKFIGDIDWQEDGVPLPERIDREHPFRPVFDAIALIKEELDALFEERRRAGRALKESQQRFDDVLKHSQDILYKRNLQNGTYDYVSDAVTHLLGFTPAAIRRMGLDGVQALVHPDDLSRFHTLNKKWQESDDAVDAGYMAEFRMRDRQGRYRWFSASHAMIRDAAGHPTFVIGSNRDITRIKALEAERQEIAERLRHTRKLEAVSTMAGGVAHHFNNLLMVILGNLEMMRMSSPVSRRLEHMITAAEKSARRAADLSTLMLTYVGQTQISPETVDLHAISSEMVAVLKTTVADHANLALEAADGSFWIHADASKVCQVITNLVTNAVEAAGPAPLEINLRVGAQHCDAAQLSRMAPSQNLSEGRYVYLWVADNGLGMDQETLEKVFDPFFTTKFTGRGLGMAAVMGIVRVHRGGIRIDSRPDAGTAVSVYFPESEPVSPARRSSAARPVRPADSLTRRTVLLVDDEPLVLELGEQMLALLGFDVLTAQGGPAALAGFAANRDCVGLAVLDISMPRMSGRETLARLRGQGAVFPVLVASGYPEAQAREKMGGDKVDGFIKKPFRIDELRDKIDEIFERSRP